MPEHEASDHIPHDFCWCKPDLVKTFGGTMCYRHNCKDFSDLIEQAEAIRVITSIELIQEDQGKDEDKRTFIPFPKGMHQVQWPMAARKEQEFTLEDEDEYDD